MRRLVPALTFIATLAACQPAAPKVDLSVEEAAIRAQVTAFNTAIAAYDEAGAAAIYAPDAVMMPPNQGRQVGPEFLTQMVAGLEPLKATFVVTPTAVMVTASGDLALEEGTWKTSVPMADGTSFEDYGKYLAGWKKTNGTWLIQYDIWNSDNAPPQAAAQ